MAQTPTKGHHGRVLLTVSTTHRPATDLGHLLRKHPDRVSRFELTSGVAHVFYPEASDDRCTAALLLDVDPVALVRGRGRTAAADSYVSDRPYAAGSLFAAALAKVFSSARTGASQQRPDLAATALPLELHIPCCPGPAGLVERLFEPLGWTVTTRREPLDETQPRWGLAPYADVTLTGTHRVADALNQLYVLLPVLDGAKHYWVNRDEVAKLLRLAGDWLPGHPDQRLIVRRYLAGSRELIVDATARLAALDTAIAEPEPRAAEVSDEDAAAPAAERVALAVRRHEAVLAELAHHQVTTVADLGCGSGSFVRRLLDVASLTRVIGTDVSATELARARRRLRLDRMPERRAARLTLLQSSVTYVDRRLAGIDAAVLMEVVEHVDPELLPALAASVFGATRPRVVVVTTPNIEHNVRYEGLADGGLRHRDHRFEWTRAEFSAWANGVCDRYDYRVTIAGVGTDDPAVGAPTQLATFVRREADHD